MVNRTAASHAVKLLGRDHALVVIHLAKKQDQMEIKWIARIREVNRRVYEEVAASIKAGGSLKLSDDIFVEFLFNHYVDVAEAAIASTQKELQVAVGRARMAGSPKLPRSFVEIRQMYDKWRRTGRVPKVFREMGRDVKEEYLKKVQSVWAKYSRDFREGNEANQENVLRKIQEAAEVGSSRAKTIVRTETTNYYNDTRREIYDDADAVTHYLFLAIRDQRTTKWCSDKVVDGKRGRHGLVYAKNDPITAKETPACHWNCRSEMVPLSPYNPRHLKLIQNLELARRNNVCHPLPEGWD